MQDAGANITDLKFSIDNGSVYLNKAPDELGVSMDVFDSCSSKVATTSDSNPVDLTQSDYFVFTSSPDMEWYSLTQINGSQLVHSNILMEGPGDERPLFQQTQKIDMPEE